MTQVVDSEASLNGNDQMRLRCEDDYGDEEKDDYLNFSKGNNERTPCYVQIGYVAGTWLGRDSVVITSRQK